MSYLNSLVWLFCFSIFFASSAHAQNKFEKEYRIKTSIVPKSALDFMTDGPFDKKIKWYAEESQDGKSIEAKTIYKNKKYSIEFNVDGKPQDVEQKIPFTSIPEDLRKQIQNSLDSIFTKSKVKKTQKQWVGPRSALISLINQTIVTENYDVNYELIVKGKKDTQYSYYEILYNDKGVRLKMLKIIHANTDNLLY
ncbi:hypothetical protein [uncultured Aquimarina sp.]|uniref:hypothetical protein n=1 Tax=uncultured Aquimarina sp. TaxID=575652 RepID=UPI0026296369|nr:hypothetical protein [uncultured Aquimarina sp.]